MNDELFCIQQKLYEGYDETQPIPTPYDAYTRSSDLHPISH
jgi:hypothetical protein